VTECPGIAAGNGDAFALGYSPSENNLSTSVHLLFTKIPYLPDPPCCRGGPKNLRPGPEKAKNPLGWPYGYFLENLVFSP
jgi:hypothetical protein